MKFCQEHWDGIKKRVEERGLGRLCAKSGQVALAQMEEHLRTGGEVTASTFDPAMACHWAIASNAMTFMAKAGIDPLYLLVDESVVPVGRSTCPLCELNLLHRGCKDPKCVLDEERGYDWMMDTAADEALATAKALGLA